MFKLQQKQSFFWPVKGSIPVDGGEFADFEFQAEIKRLPQSKIDELVKKLTSEKSDMTLKDIASQLLVGWKGVYDDGGEKEVPFSPDARRQVLDVAGVAASVVEAAFEAFRGGRAKN